ncbi:hypothetical protein EYC80_001978 [Monilinia laxa]|uniref:Uncharacterized protein n=1 Tax=Monilinia laxa TaxID=61186 RepID=A0A5N6K6N2_MONLA|nr:hypothetical protein EYC80_001978 [Monilinia laxa]
MQIDGIRGLIHGGITSGPPTILTQQRDGVSELHSFPAFPFFNIVVVIHIKAFQSPYPPLLILRIFSSIPYSIWGDPTLPF